MGAVFKAVALLTVLAGPVFVSQGAAASEGSGQGVAIFAGGCFWCVEKDFDHVPGVVSTLSGYVGGKTDNPTYESVTRGGTGHREAVEIRFDPARVSYAELVEIFWRSVDPTDGGGQFCDRGHSYTTAIFPVDDEQVRVAEASKARLVASKRLEAPIATTIERAGKFHAAEDYHQDYYQKNPVRYRFYRASCGRDGRVQELWGKEAHQGIEKH